MKLVTTMGVELTFVPAVHERIFVATKGKVNSTKAHAEGYLLEFLCTAMKQGLQANNIPHFKCHVDPGCVEVPTKAYSTARTLGNAIRRIRALAKQCDTVPTASYTIGGGAHIHTGVLGETDEQRAIYKSAFALWAYNNPWMAWAFAGINDASNANPISYNEVLGQEEAVEDLIARYEYEYGEYKAERHNAAHATKIAHEIGTDEFILRHYMRRADESRKWCVRHRSNMLKLAQKILDYYMSDAENPPTIPYKKVMRQQTKNTFIRHTSYGKQGTVEFRCFLMPKDTKGHDKHIALVNAICQRVWDQARACVDGMLPRPQKINLNMKYSEAAKGFNNMLAELNLNPADYRRERVNIALRMRYQRTH